MAAPMDERDFESSELGTKDYWDKTYERELETFNDIGDVGEIWFGEDSQERVLKWIDFCSYRFDEDSEERLLDWYDAIIDLGCGNGMMLIELHKRGYANLTGVDYAPGALDLAKSIAKKEDRPEIKYEVGDLISDCPSRHCKSLCRQYKMCIDKGTYDAISLMPSESHNAYVQCVKKLMSQSSLFVLTSCNWTKEQLLQRFSADFDLFDEIRTPTFKFGGKTGRTVTSLIFKLKT